MCARSQVGVGHDLKLSSTADFLVNDNYIFEIGGKTKSNQQIKDLKNAWLVLDDIENGVFNRLPLWMFGFLY